MVSHRFFGSGLLAFVLSLSTLIGLLASTPIAAISLPLTDCVERLPAVERNDDVDCLKITDVMSPLSRSNPANNATNIAIDADIHLSFNQPINVIGSWFELVCSETGHYFMNGFAVMGEGQNWLVDPFTDFAYGERCTMTIFADGVSAQDGSPLEMNADYSFSFTIEALVPPLNSGWVINEIHADPASGISGDANGDGVRDGAEDEFVEIVNNTGGDVDISGWTLADSSTTRHTFPANTTVANGCAIVVFGGGTPTGAFGGAVVQTTSGALALNNGGDTVTLNDSAMDQATYTYGTEGGNNESLTLDPDVTGSTPLVGHSTATGSGGALFSPGTKIDGSAFSGCTASDTTPSVSSTSPSDGETGGAVDANITLNFSENVTVSGNWFQIACQTSGTRNVSDTSVSGGAQEWTIDPTSDFSHAESCTMSIFAAQVTDQDGTPDNMAGDYSFTFTVVTASSPQWVINELQADPDSTNGDANGDGTVNTSEDEFIELVNNTGSEVDISGWTLADGSGTRHTFAANTRVANGCAIVVFGGGTPTGEFGGAVVQTTSSGSLALNNGGDTVTLNDGAMDQATYTYGGEGGNNQSITLSPDITGSTPLVLHSTATGSGGALFSPGTKIDGSAFGSCTVADTAPSVSSTSPSDGAGGVVLDADITINFSEDVLVSGSWYDITCTETGNHSATVNGSSPTNTFTLNPDSDFTDNESCTVTIIASLVSDADTDDPPDTMASNYSWTFTTLITGIVINEIMQNPSAVDDSLGEWIELYNAGTNSVNLNGCILKDDGSDEHPIDNGGALNIAAGGYLVLGRNDNQATNGEAPVDYQYSNFSLNNGADQVILECDGSEVDRVEYDGGPNFPDPSGASMELSDTTADNNLGSNWALATKAFGAGDLGTPGGVNDALAVALADFSAEPVDDDILLRWETVLELDNLGFNLYRSTTPDEPNTALNPQLIPSQVPGSGQGTAYQFIDSTVEPAITYYYWLEDVDRNGSKALHGPISIIAPETTQITIKTLTARLEPPEGHLLIILVVMLVGSVSLWQALWRQRMRE